MNISIHDVTKIEVRANSFSYYDQNESDRCHIQKLSITDKQGNQYQITLFFENLSDVLPVGEISGLDQASSNEDYLGLLETPKF